MLQIFFLFGSNRKNIYRKANNKIFKFYLFHIWILKKLKEIIGKENGKEILKQTKSEHLNFINFFVFSFI